MLDAIAAPVQSIDEPAPETLEPFLCTVCDADGNLAPADETYEFDPETGEAFCRTCWETRSLVADQSATTYEQLLAFANRIAESLPGGCVVHVDPPGYTIEDRARDLLQEEKDKVSARFERAHSGLRRGNAA